MDAIGVSYAFRKDILPRTQFEAGSVDCLVVNTTGELLHFYQRADVVFVGKSLTAEGGQNPIEPAALGKPVVFGPNMQNFPDIAPAFVRKGGAVQVADVAELERVLADLLADPARRQAMGLAAKEVVRENQGSIGRTAEMILTAIER